MEPWGKRVYFGTAGAAVNIVDADGRLSRIRRSRTSTTSAASSTRWSTSISFSAPSLPRDLPIPPRWISTRLRRASARTTKHVGTSWVQPGTCASLAGDASRDRRRRGQMARAALRQPVQLLRRAADEIRHRRLQMPGGRGRGRHAGAAALGGSGRRHGARLARRRARAGSRRSPGGPRLRQRDQARRIPPSSALWCFVSDLRTGAMSGGSPEQALLSSMAAQMAHFYDLTGGTASGMTDSKIARRAGRARRRRSTTRWSAIPAPT